MSRSGKRFQCVILLVCCLLTALSSISFGRRYSQSGRPLLTPEQFKQKLAGPILSIGTPFTASLDIDHEAVTNRIKKALRYQCKIVTLTAGDSRYNRITYEEVQMLTRTVALAVEGDAIFIGATGDWPIEQVIDYAHFCESLGAAGLLVKLNTADTKEDETVTFLKQVADNTVLGLCLLGNCSEPLLDKLIEIPSFVALKEDVGLQYLIDRLVKYGDRLEIFPGGTDSRYLTAYPYGARASFSSLYSYAPQIGLQYWEAIRADDILKAGQIVKKYDAPFLQNYSHQFWYATMDYFNGTNTFLRKANMPIEPEMKMTDEEMIRMEQLYQKMGLAPEPYTSCAVTEGPALPLSRGGHAGGIVMDTPVIAGGNDWSADKTTKHWLDETLIYQDGRWRQGPSLPHKAAYMMYAWDSSGLYIAGGTDGETLYSQAYCLSSRDSWTPLAPLPTELSSGSGAVLNGRLYVACGSMPNGDTNKMYALDLSKKTGQWKECASLPSSARIFPGFVACGQSLYLFGGLMAKPFTPLQDAYQYHPDSDTWEKLGDLSVPGYYWAASPIDDSHLIMTGMANSGGVNNGVWILSLDGMKLQKVSSTPLGACSAPLVKIGDQQWWTIGGEPDATLRRINDVYKLRLR